MLNKFCQILALKHFVSICRKYLLYCMDLNNKTLPHYQQIIVSWDLNLFYEVYKQDLWQSPSNFYPCGMASNFGPMLNAK